MAAEITSAANFLDNRVTTADEGALADKLDCGLFISLPECEWNKIAHRLHSID